MSVARSTGSPTLRRTPGSTTAQMDENTKVGGDNFSVSSPGDQLKSLLNFQELNGASSHKRPVGMATGVLSTSSLVNQSCPQAGFEGMAQLNDTLQRMSLGQRTQQGLDSFGTAEVLEANRPDPSPPMLGRQSTGLPPIGSGLTYSAEGSDGPRLEHTATSSSVPITPATEMFGSTGPSTRPASATMNESAPSDEEVMRLKFELAQAQSKITRLQELASTRHGHLGQGQPTDASPIDIGCPDIKQPAPPAPRPMGLHSTNANTHYISREASRPWSSYDDSRSDTSDALSATGFNRSRNIWGGVKPIPNAVGLGGPHPLGMPQNGPWAGRAASHSYVEPTMSYEPAPADNFRPDRLTPDFDFTTKPPGSRRGSRYDARFGGQAYGSAGQSYSNQPSYGGYSFPQGQYEPGVITSGGSQNSMSTGVYANYQPTPVGTSLSPLASEFTSISVSAGPWKSESTSAEGQTYLPTTEPLNYRRLLDRNVNCNWKYIVDKIVCSNDQQASIFLQQKLKVGTPDQKYEIVEAIVAQAYPLMVNRFGNFLVQRCFEHGTPEQVIKIAEAIRGCTLTLSMDPFGCHVVQKAFDSVPEDYKAIMVHELLRRIPETVIHRYACHVWQKLFELRWTESPPQIMKYVNEALRGMWHEVALGETGSLVVQNIFENCLEEDKRPCIEEVLSNINIVAHGQFGNWCIQHICEHGAPADRSRAIDHVIRYAAEYSMDQYASKVVEKCLKIGGAEFLTRYLDRVCEGRIDRPRIPLIDIASDQYGNYLIQWILQHANPQHKEIVAAHIRKHMVSLRGSKFGSRVGMLCTNPAIATRPGPGVGPGVGRMPAGPRYSGRGYQ